MYRPGAVLAKRYRLDERVGGGGMGEVWRGTDTELERTVAVKIVRSELLDEPGFRERFRVEARTMAKIKHPGVVAVHDYYSDDAGAFLVMEFIEGEALSTVLRRLGRLDAARAMTLVADAADALHAAHERGVVHRDIKPANLIVSAGGKLVLTDFGIARSAANTTLTATGALIGTASYLAPEQVLGKPATAQSDVYALGVVAYECLAGRRPFDGENPFDVALRRLREPPPTIAVQLPPAVLLVVERALAAEPAQRWRSAAELAGAARQAAVGAVAGAGAYQAPPAPPAPRSPAAHASPVAYPSPPRPAYASTPPTPTPPPPVGPRRPGPPYAPTTPSHPPAVPYPVAGYRAPAYGAAGHRPAMPPQNNTLGLLGMIFGIVGIALAICYVGVAPGVAGIVLGLLGLKKASEGQATNRGQAIAGIVCGAAAVAIFLLLLTLGMIGNLAGW
jgi:serine/threonine-protein kinase